MLFLCVFVVTLQAIDGLGLQLGNEVSVPQHVQGTKGALRPNETLLMILFVLFLLFGC